MFKKFTILTALSLALTAPTSAQQDMSGWKEIKQNNLLYLELDTGRVTIQLADFFAGNNVRHLRELVRSGLYTQAPLYRVIENFVVQGGPLREGDVLTDQQKLKMNRTVSAEFDRDIDRQAHFFEVQEGDLYAEKTGFINSFAVGRSEAEGKEWLIHCTGSINIARGADPNSGTSSFAIMFGTSQRYLDRNMSVIGRVIDGWDAFYSVKRAPEETGGVFQNTDEATKIQKAYLGSSLPAEERQTVYVEDTASTAWSDFITSRREMKNDFFVQKGTGKLDVCQRLPRVRVLN